MTMETPRSVVVIFPVIFPAFISCGIISSLTFARFLANLSLGRQNQQKDGEIGSFNGHLDHEIQENPFKNEVFFPLPRFYHGLVGKSKILLSPKVIMETIDPINDFLTNPFGSGKDKVSHLRL